MGLSIETLKGMLDHIAQGGGVNWYPPCDATPPAGSKELKLSGQGLTDAHIDVIANAISKGMKLRYLKLNDNMITDKGAKKLAAAISRVGRSEMMVLDLAHNQVGDPGALALAQAHDWTRVKYQRMDWDMNYNSMSLIANPISRGTLERLSKIETAYRPKGGPGV